MVSVHCIRGRAGCVLQENMKKHREAGLLLVNEGQVFDSLVLSGKKQVWGFMMSSFMVTTGSQLCGASSQVCNSNKYRVTVNK